MSRKQYIVMWPVGGSLASSREDHNRIVGGRIIDHLVIKRPGMQDVSADGCLDNFMRHGGGRVSFDGISEWLRSRGWAASKRGLPFAIIYIRDNRTLVFSFIGDIMK